MIIVKHITKYLCLLGAIFPVFASNNALGLYAGADISYLHFNKADVSRQPLASMKAAKGITSVSPFFGVSMSPSTALELHLNYFLSNEEGKGPFECTVVVVFPVCGSPLYSEREITMVNYLLMMKWQRKLAHGIYWGLIGGGGVSRYQVSGVDYTSDPHTIIQYDTSGKLAAFGAFFSYQLGDSRWGMRIEGDGFKSRYDDQSISSDGIRISLQFTYAFTRPTNF